MGLRKVQKQGREERAQEDYPTSSVYFLQMYMYGSVLVSFCLMPCFCTFSGPSLLEIRLCTNIFSLVYVLFLGFLSQLPNKTRLKIVSTYYLPSSTISCSRRAHLSLVTRLHFTFPSHTCMHAHTHTHTCTYTHTHAHTHTHTHIHTQLHVATSDFQATLRNSSKNSASKFFIVEFQLQFLEGRYATNQKLSYTKIRGCTIYYLCVLAYWSCSCPFGISMLR